MIRQHLPQTKSDLKRQKPPQTKREKAAPHIRHAEKEKLAALLKALSAYDFQKAAAESVGVSKDMMKHIMKDFRKFLKDNPEEAELLKMSLMDGV